ncbi:cardiolipin synthase B [Verrucomicrobiota bacterium]|nr:cardiolipin synthase B [Verrucomicrobiota bacterium]
MPETTNATTFTWLDTVDAAYAAMLAAIGAATRSVRLETYIFTSSPIADAFRDALVQACQRGVNVQLLIDAWGSPSLSDDYWRPFIAAGGKFRWFNPFNLSRFGIRNHRKLLVCDDRTAFVGGFNIAPEYQGDGVTRGWRDLGLRLDGELAEQLGATFDELFNRAELRLLSFDRLLKLVKPGTPQLPASELLLTGPGFGQNRYRTALARDLNHARAVQITSAYFLPSWRIRRALAKVARSGGQVQLLLAGRSDVGLAQLAARSFYQRLLRTGVEIYEYQPQILHAKSVRIDDVVYVGSANLDTRSLHINYELMIRVQDRALAAVAEQSFQRDLTHCRRIDPATWPHTRTFFAKLKERIACFLLARVDPYIARRQMRNLR